MSDSDDYEVVTTADKPEVTTDKPDVKVGGPVGDMDEIDVRRRSNASNALPEGTRKAFQALVDKMKGATLDTGELVPADTAPPAPAAPKPEEDLVPVDTAAPAPAAPAIPVAAPAIEPRAAAADAAAKAIAEQQAKAMEERAKALEEREKQLNERMSKLPGGESWLDKPTATLKLLVQTQLGLTDEEWKDFQADFISEATAESLGVPLDATHKTGIEARRAKLVVRTYTAEQKKQAEALKAEQARFAEEQKKLAEEQAEQHRAAAARQAIGQMLQPLSTTHPFLFKNHDNADPAEVVYHVLKNQRDAFVKQYGEGAASQFKPDVPAAAKLANDYYKTQYDNLTKHYSTLLAPTPAPPAPAAVKPSPQVSAQVPRSTTQTPPKAEPEQPANDPVSDWRAERAANRRKRLERFSSATPEE